MSDTFFGFETDLSSKGSDKLDDNVFDYHTRTTPEEDEAIDLINDETFGDDIGVGDWEEEHKKSLAILEGSSGFCSTGKDYDGQEEFMQESITHLVEDGEIDDPAVMTVSKSRPIPVKKSDLDELFGPASPPAFLDTEHLVSPGKPDIWGSPTRPMHMSPEKQYHNGENQLLRMLQQSQHSHGEPSAAMADHSVSTRLTTSLSVENIEQGLKKMLGQAPLTVEDLERQLHGTVNTEPAQVVPTMNQGFPILPHGMHTVMGQRPVATTSSPQVVPQSLYQTPPGRVVGTPSPPLVNQVPHPSIGSSLAGSPLTMYPSPVAQLMLPYGPQALPGVLAGVPPNQMHLLNRFHSPPPGMAQRGQMRYGAMMSGSPNGPRIPPHSAYSDPSHMRGQRAMYRGQRSQGQYHHPQYNNQNRMHYDNNNSHHSFSYEVETIGRPGDPYAGIMTQKEKDWVIKIQLIQLHTENPYIDDYYYTTHAMQKLTREKRARENSEQTKTNQEKNEPKLLLPAMAKVETRQYTPTQFAGSLGKLTSSSVHKPRQILDVGKSNTINEEEEKSGVKDARRNRKLLFDIEKTYDLLLQIDDIEKKVLSMPEDGREPLLEERQHCIERTYQRLHSKPDTNDQFVQLTSKRKGLKLVGRVLEFLNKEESQCVVSAILRNITVLVKRDQQHQTLDSIRSIVTRVIKAANFESMLNFAKDLLHNSGHVAAMQNKFGVTVVSQLVSRAETLYSTNEDELDIDSKQSWCEFVSSLSEAFLSLPDKSLESMVSSCPQIQQHFERILDAKTVGNVEKKIESVSGK